MKRVMVQLTEDQDSWLVAEAGRQSTSKAHVVRMMVQQSRQNRSPTTTEVFATQPEQPDLRLPPDKSWLKTEPVRGQGKPTQDSEPSGHVCHFEYQRERPGKKTNPNKLYTCDCGNQEWRHQ